MAGLIIARYRNLNSVRNAGGFSLPEALFALLLMALSSSALLQYHRALSLGFSQQWQQREAWRVAGQRLIGRETTRWQSSLQRSGGPNGCTLERAEVSGPHQRSATLSRLRC